MCFSAMGKNRSTHDEELLCCTGHRGTAGTQCLAYKYKNAFPRHHFTSSRVTILLAEAKTPLTVRVIQWWPTPALTASRKLKAKKEKNIIMSEHYKSSMPKHLKTPSASSLLLLPQKPCIQKRFARPSDRGVGEFALPIALPKYGPCANKVFRTSGAVVGAWTTKTSVVYT